MRVGVIGESLCLLMPSMSSDIGGFGEIGEFGEFVTGRRAMIDVFLLRTMAAKVTLHDRT